MNALTRFAGMVVLALLVLYGCKDDQAGKPQAVAQSAVDTAVPAPAGIAGPAGASETTASPEATDKANARAADKKTGADQEPDCK